MIEQIVSDWGLKVGEPYLPGGQCACVAPARDRGGVELALKVGWRHREAEHEADALRFWDGDGAVRCFNTRTVGKTTVLLLERCTPGTQLGRSLPEPEQDVVIAALLRRLWARHPSDADPFGSLATICDQWAASFEQDFERDSRGLDPGLAREGIAMLRELPRSADRRVLLSTDLRGAPGDRPGGPVAQDGRAARAGRRPGQDVAVRTLRPGIDPPSPDARARPPVGSMTPNAGVGRPRRESG